MRTDRAAAAEAAMGRIDSWLRQNAPGMHASLRSSASEDTIAMLESDVGRPLPPDLRSMWLYANGMDPKVLNTGGRLIPGGLCPFGAEEARDERRMWMDIFRRILPGPVEPFIEGQDHLPAGTACQIWLPVWIPIADDHVGTYLFVDLRDGANHGCVTEFYRDGGSAARPRWRDTAAMLTDLADRLERSEPDFDHAGRIYWP